MDAHSDLDVVRDLLARELDLAPRVAAALDAGSGLFGDLPELDSMAVARVLTAVEDEFGFIIDDDEVDAEMFATLGSLTAFVTAKRQVRAA